MYVPIANTHDEAAKRRELSISPVASQRTLQLIYRLRTSSRVKIKMFNAFGKVSREFDLGTLIEGTHTSQIDVSQMSPGIYSLQLIRGKISNTTKRAVILY